MLPKSDSINHLKECLEERIRYGYANNDKIHSIYDSILEEHLEEIDPEFLSEMEKLVEGIDFWYS